jgi:hypothetical protein
LLDEQGRRTLEEMVVRILQGRPGIAIVGIALINGSTSNLMTASMRDAAELILRRNGIPIAASCDGAQTNCGRLVMMVRAICKNLLPTDPVAVCGGLVRIEYLEAVNSKRAKPNPDDSFGDVWDNDVVGLFRDDSIEAVARQKLTEWIEQFALYYLRANPRK